MNIAKMEIKFGYVELELSKESKSELSKLVSSFIKPDEYYYSDVIPRINGDVTSKAHLTIFYGLYPGAIKDPELIKLVNNIKIQTLKINKLGYLDGYQNLYKVIYAEVYDANEQLKILHDNLLNFDHDPALGERKFIPHITLAYVKKDFVIPNDLKIHDLELKIEKAGMKI